MQKKTVKYQCCQASSSGILSSLSDVHPHMDADEIRTAQRELQPPYVVVLPTLCFSFYHVFILLIIDALVCSDGQPWSYGFSIAFLKYNQIYTVSVTSESHRTCFDVRKESIVETMVLGSIWSGSHVYMITSAFDSASRHRHLVERSKTRHPSYDYRFLRRG